MTFHSDRQTHDSILPPLCRCQRDDKRPEKEIRWRDGELSRIWQNTVGEAWMDRSAKSRGGIAEFVTLNPCNLFLYNVKTTTFAQLPSCLFFFLTPASQLHRHVDHYYTHWCLESYFLQCISFSFTQLSCENKCYVCLCVSHSTVDHKR